MLIQKQSQKQHLQYIHEFHTPWIYGIHVLLYPEYQYNQYNAKLIRMTVTLKLLHLQAIFLYNRIHNNERIQQCFVI